MFRSVCKNLGIADVEILFIVCPEDWCYERELSRRTSDLIYFRHEPMCGDGRTDRATERADKGEVLVCHSDQEQEGAVDRKGVNGNIDDLQFDAYGFAPFRGLELDGLPPLPTNLSSNELVLVNGL